MLHSFDHDDTTVSHESMVESHSEDAKVVSIVDFTKTVVDCLY